MNFYLTRYCKEKPDQEEPRPLSDYFNQDYVLLAEAGLGKTSSFKYEADRSGGVYIEARKFLNGQVKKEWRGKILFIDSLDEIKDVRSEKRQQVDAICARLKELDNPTFHIACRAADWVKYDQEEFDQAAHGSKILVLYLQPLSPDDIIDFLNQKNISSKSFVQKAKQFGLDHLLQNPQNLQILIKATQNKKWPNNKKEMYELACSNLVEELHEGRRIEIEYPARNELLNSAGLLATYYVLGNLSGYALSPHQGDPDHPLLSNLPDYQPSFKDVLKSRLFETQKDFRIPQHRNTMEFLTARYLASLLDENKDTKNKNSLSWRRLLALMVKSDGKTISSLRGLWGWLANFVGPEKQQYLIEQDPLAIARYTDLQVLNTKNKIYLLDIFYQEAEKNSWTVYQDRLENIFLGNLATKEMVASFKKILESTEKSDGQKIQTKCVLLALQQGKKLTSYLQLLPALSAIVKDHTQIWWLRKYALIAWLKIALPKNSAALNDLLADFNVQKIQDENDELFGTLLENLYPDFISAAQVFNYLHVPAQSNWSGSYSIFWNHTLIRQAEKDPSAIPKLLEALHKKEFLQEKEKFYIERLINFLLVEGIHQYGNSVPTSKLYAWLDIDPQKFADKDTGQQIAKWLQARPEQYKNLFLEHIKHAPDDENKLRSHFFFDWPQRVARATPPPGFSAWLLNQIKKFKEPIASILLEEAICLIQTNANDSGVTIDQLFAWIKRHPQFQPTWKRMSFIEFSPSQQEFRQQSALHKNLNAMRRKERIQFFHQQKSLLQGGKAAPAVLFDLAMAYRGQLVQAPGTTPEDRLFNLLGEDHDLVQAAMMGIKHSLERVDLPDADAVIQLAVDGQQHLMSMPCLVAAEIIARENKNKLPEKYDGRLKLLIAIQLTLGFDSNPTWFREVLQKNPKLVSEVFIQYASALFKAKKSVGFGQFEHDEDYGLVALIAVPILLNRFPLRVSRQLLYDFEVLLKIGLKCINHKKLLTLIKQKLSRPSLENQQRMLWLTAGFLIEPTTFHKKFEACVTDQEKAIKITGFLIPFEKQLKKFSISTLSLLIRLLAAQSTPPWILDTLEVGEYETYSLSRFVDRAIDELSQQPDHAAATALHRLMMDNALHRWRTKIQSALSKQAIVEREAHFKFPGIEKIYQSLSNRCPANAADLAAVTVEYIELLAKNIRDGANNRYRIYWNYPKDLKEATPRTELECRDIFLEDLGLHVKKHSIYVDKEKPVAEDKRADIKVTFEDCWVPLEIKLDHNRELWTGLQNQLIDQYTRDPKTEGYGIYLVFWFGGKKMPVSPIGKKPENPQQLTSQLQALLKPEDKHRITVYVIDCSLPMKKQ